MPQHMYRNIFIAIIIGLSKFSFLFFLVLIRFKISFIISCWNGAHSTILCDDHFVVKYDEIIAQKESHSTIFYGMSTFIYLFVFSFFLFAVVFS